MLEFHYIYNFLNHLKAKDSSNIHSTRAATGNTV